ncbi:elongation factor G [Devosia nitrariae]|uniref:Elongation factor G n=1 Tax=Devosia nitrariae TaxID=2071872 RepID=A0ABQ5VZD3_9HYPH|nr:elongation factor G [Devosia nitrariae]GLQ52934.1 elongation factor G [Devosia nitrariae]
MRCFTVLGPSQSGKSTLAGQLASLEVPRKSSVVPHGLELLTFEFLDEAWCALDTPGSNEALAHVHAVLLASDACILCVSPSPDDALLAAPYLRVIEASGTPCIVFVNKMDDPRGRVRDLIAALQDYTSHPLVLRQIPIREGDKVVGSCDLISERAWRYREGERSSLVELPEDLIDREHEARAELLEHLSEFDDWLLEELVEDRKPTGDALFAISSRVLRENRVIPVLVGAAGHGNGVMRLMKSLRHEAPTMEATRMRLAFESGIDEKTLVGVSFHAHYSQNIGKAVLVRALTDGIKQGTMLGGGNLGALQDPTSGRPFAGSGPAEGAVFAAIKSDHLRAPALLTGAVTVPAPAWVSAPNPALERIVVPASERDEVKLGTALARLADTDGGLTVTQDPASGAHVVAAQGPVHLREVLGALSETFRIDVSDQPITPAFREAISKVVEVQYRHRKQTGGAGQFADVQLTVRPTGRGEGFIFAEEVKGGAVPRKFIPAVEEGAREALEKGPLGFPVIDVGVVLTDGRFHSVDSSEFAFRTAARMGVRQALSQASPVLMQPIFRVDIHVPSQFSGSLVPIVSALKGQVLGFDRDEAVRGWDTFRALMPASALEELAHGVRSATQGVGYFSSSFERYEELYGRDAEAVVNAQAKAG